MPPLAEWLTAVLPQWIKASLDWHETWPHDAQMYNPPEVCKNRSEWLKLDVDLDLKIAFGAPVEKTKAGGKKGDAQKEEGEAAVGVGKGGGAKKAGPRTEEEEERANPNWNNLNRPQLRFEGRGCWPTLGAIEIVNLDVTAGATIWWEVFGGRFLVAFHEENTPEIHWDIELGVGGCGAEMPDWLEDRFLNWLGTRILRSFGRINPLVIEPEDEPEDEQILAARRIQERARRSSLLQKHAQKAGKGKDGFDAKLDELDALCAELKALQARTHEVHGRVTSLAKELRKAK